MIFLRFLQYFFVKVFWRTVIDDLNQNYERSIIAQEKFFEEQRQREVSENISVALTKLDVVLNSIEIYKATEGGEQVGPILQKLEELQKQVLNMEKQNMASNQSYERSIIAQEKFFEEHRQKEVSENISVALNKLDIVLNSIEVSKTTEGGEQGGLILQKIEELQKQVLNMEKHNMAVSKKLRSSILIMIIIRKWINLSVNIMVMLTYTELMRWVELDCALIRKRSP